MVVSSIISGSAQCSWDEDSDSDSLMPRRKKASKPKQFKCDMMVWEGLDDESA